MKVGWMRGWQNEVVADRCYGRSSAPALSGARHAAAALQLLLVHSVSYLRVSVMSTTPWQRLYLEVGRGASILSFSSVLSGENGLIVLTKIIIDLHQRPPAHGAHRGIVNAHLPHILPYQR